MVHSDNSSCPPVLVITGPTASGKSALALELAEQLDGEIICADSLTVYRGLDIGSAKPTAQDRAQVPHHLLDIRNPWEPFTAADFRHEAAQAICDIVRRGKRPILAGGAGLYLRVLLGGLADAPGQNPQIRELLSLRAKRGEGELLFEELRTIDPETASKTHPHNLPRIIRALEVYLSSGIPLSHYQNRHGFGQKQYNARQYLLAPPKELLYQRIDARVDQMLRDGLIEEYCELLKMGVPKEAKALGAIGYKEVAAFVDGIISREELPRLIKMNSRHYAKRQMTWFRREKELLTIAYPPDSATIAREAVQFLRQGDR